MNDYVRKLFGVMFQRKQTQQIVHMQPQPLPTSPEEWRQHWHSQGQSWRTEPEIDAKRQDELSKRRAIVPDIEKGVYPFREVKLSRADVEWLLATHENGRGPINWSDESQRKRIGIDLRGADVCQVDLSKLPLARLVGGLSWDEWESVTVAHLDMAGVRLEQAILTETHLERAYLRGAYLKGADLSIAHLEEARLYRAHLEGANLYRARLERASLREAYLMGANLQRAYFDGTTTALENALLGSEKAGFVSLADVHWGNVNLSLIEWSSVSMLGDESKAKQIKAVSRKTKQQDERLRAYQVAVRANRQLAVALQSQGLNEDAARFAYRAQVLQRMVLWKQRNFWKWSGYVILALLAGYGYRMWRIIVAYLLIVFLCAGAYFVLGMYYQPHLSFLEAVLTSITAFHGRVFSEPFLRSDDPQLWVTAFEAVTGIIIEGVFIAMLTQKFFGK